MAGQNVSAASGWLGWLGCPRCFYEGWLLRVRGGDLGGVEGREGPADIFMVENIYIYIHTYNTVRVCVCVCV